MTVKICTDELLEKAKIDGDKIRRKVEETYTPEMLNQILENLVASKFDNFILAKADRQFNYEIDNYVSHTFYNVMEEFKIEKTFEAHILSYLKSADCEKQIRRLLKGALRGMFTKLGVLEDEIY